MYDRELITKMVTQELIPVSLIAKQHGISRQHMYKLLEAWGVKPVEQNRKMSKLHNSILELHAQGLPNCEIERVLGTSGPTVIKVLRDNGRKANKRPPYEEPPQKVCIMCKFPKDRGEFYKRSDRPGLTMSYCKSCFLARAKQ